MPSGFVPIPIGTLGALAGIAGANTLLPGAKSLWAV